MGRRLLVEGSEEAWVRAPGVIQDLVNTVVGDRSETKLKQLVEVLKKVKSISSSRARAKTKQGSPLPAVQTSLKGAGILEASL